MIITMPPISTKRTITSHLHSLNTKKTTTYYFGNSDPCLGWAHKCDGVKPVKGIATFPSLCIYKQTTQICTYSLPLKRPTYITKNGRQHNMDSTIASVRFSRSTNITCYKRISTFYAYMFLLLSSFDKSSK